MNFLPPQQFVKYNQTEIVLDLRLSAAYQKGHLPRALHFPIYPNHLKSYQKRVVAASSKLPPQLEKLAKSLRQVAGDQRVFLYDKDGSLVRMVADLLSRKGGKSVLLEGGYLAWKKVLPIIFSQPYQLRLLGGYAGSQKTEMLYTLREKGQQMIDLEGLAGHRGSVFGGINLPPQPSHDTFNNTLARTLCLLDKTQPIWLENETQVIGKVGIHRQFWQIMKAAPIYKLNVSREKRLDHLTEEYGNYSLEKLRKAIEALGRLDPRQKVKIIAALEQGDRRKMIDLLMNYYDEAYDFLLQQHEKVVEVEPEYLWGFCR